MIRDLKTILFVSLIMAMLIPYTGMMANAKSNEHSNYKAAENNKSKLKSKIATSTDLQEQEYFKTALNMVEKIQLQSKTFDTKQIKQLDKEIQSDYEYLVKYIRENGHHTKATPAESDKERTLSTSVNSELSMSNVNAEITKVTSGTHVFTTLHSRNDCQNVGHGTTAGSLTDLGNYQFLSVYVSYPSDIKSGYFPNCTNHSWSTGEIAFVDVFNTTLCSASPSNNSGWHGGNCNGWSSVGSLTIASANGVYSGGNLFQLVPALGFVL